MLAMILSFSQVNAQMDTLHVRFLYGSKPKPEFRKKQKPWFGGMLGGHVGLRYNDTSFLSFFYEGKVHIFQNKKRIGKTYEVLIEGLSKKSDLYFYGRTTHNCVAVFKKNNYKIGDYVNVKISDCTTGTLKGEII